MTAGDAQAIRRPPHWTKDAACTVHPASLWHSPDPADQATATLICSTCPVRPYCLRDYGADPYGIIAGLTPQQRGDLLGVTRADIRAPHGTRSRYIGSRRWPGCRCDDCHAAHAAYERAQRARRKAARAAGAR